MNAADMHIRVNLGVQKIASFQVDSLLPEELDIELTKSVNRFVKQRYSKYGNKYQAGFEESQKRIDDLRTLVKEYSSDTVYKGQISNNHYIDSFQLPTPGSGLGDQDYMILLNQRSFIYHNSCKPIEFFDNITIPTGSLANVSINTAGSYVSCVPTGMVIGGGGTGAVLQIVMDALDQHVIDVIITDAGTGYTTAPTIDMHTCAAGGSATDAEAANVTIELEYTTSTYRAPVDTENTKTMATFNKFSQQDDIYKLLEDPFNTTKYNRPLTTIRDTFIDVYTDDSFIVNKVKVMYLKHPNTIEVAQSGSGGDCDLPLHTHDEIVDMTINSILEGISDPRYQTNTAEVSKSE